MSYFRFWQRRKEKASSKGTVSSRRSSINPDLLGVDLFAQLTYMAAISEAGVGRSQLFEYASRLPYTCSKYFVDVHFLAQHLHYDYAQACGVVGQGIKEGGGGQRSPSAFFGVPFIRRIGDRIPSAGGPGTGRGVRQPV